ncbi:hypothetical protein K402DRAFT_454206 [Aulographum hederae CBS 113979]|uniref:VOC domain-containing protein n=1 Tax=Aulographum hederae CBS 113979 TaxID=1176131 RepID=A0A6G1H0G6_9PEZI|nr:hypothetical protein K402DRAFT_454206 [Aulographum hederae CBS 113979]
MAPKLAAVGIGVTSLDRSKTFYTTLLPHLTHTATFNVPAFSEYVLSSPTGAAIVLMQYPATAKPPRTVVNSGGKLVFYVEDVGKQMQIARGMGAKVVLDSTTGEGGGTFGTYEAIGMCLDPDGFLVEFLPVPKPVRAKV